MKAKFKWAQQKTCGQNAVQLLVRHLGWYHGEYLTIYSAGSVMERHTCICYEAICSKEMVLQEMAA